MSGLKARPNGAQDSGAYTCRGRGDDILNVGNKRSILSGRESGMRKSRPRSPVSVDFLQQEIRVVRGV